jgi:hypothetical protein
MNQHDYDSLLSSLNEAVTILNRNRTPDPSFIAAYDTLKQARAMIEKAVAAPQATRVDFPVELAA